MILNGSASAITVTNLFFHGMFGFFPAQHLVYLWVTPMQLLLFQVSVMQLLSFRFTVFRQWHPNAVFPGVVFDSLNIGSDTNMVLKIYSLV